MERPSIKRVLASVAMIGVGASISASMVYFPSLFFTPFASVDDPQAQQWVFVLLLAMFYLCGTLIGAGVFNLFKVALLGALLGTALWGGFWLVHYHLYN